MSTEANSLPFNPEQFLGAQFNEANSTELLPIPEGEYIAVSDPVGLESFKQFDIKKGDRAGQKGMMLILKWNINDENGQLKEHLGRAPQARQSVMLDMGQGGTLEFGKGRNVGLGRVREALGQNLTGKPWAFSMLGGAVAKIKVKHRIDGGNTYAEVTEVTKAG
jgi:hypothetical protein